MKQIYEFSHEVRAEKVAADGFDIRFEASEKARNALAIRYDIVSVDAVTGQARLVRESDGMTIAVSGSFTADVTQACVATLEPVQTRIEEEFEGFFLDESQAASFKRAKAKREEDVLDEDFMEENLDDGDETRMIDEREDPEPVVDGVIDVGELVAQYLSLALNPFPHSEIAPEEGLEYKEFEENPSPFAGLKDMLEK